MATASIPLHLIDHHKIVEAFGYWPLFHDAELRSITLDRNRVLFGTISNPCIELVFHALEWTEAQAAAPPISIITWFTWNLRKPPMFI